MPVNGIHLLPILVPTEIRVSLAKDWLIQRIFGPVMRPVARLIVGVIAIPLLRAVRSRVQPAKEWDEEFEKDLDQWFRASVVLLLATKNVELAIAAWMNIKFQIELDHWWVAAGRLLLAIGVVETMPDQQLFSIIHPGPAKLKWIKGAGLWGNIQAQARPFCRGVLCQHLNRSSPVLAIMAAIFDGTVGWVCYLLAIIQYLIIGLVTSRDKALDVLSQFDREMARRRKEIEAEFESSRPDTDRPHESDFPVSLDSTCDRRTPPTPANE